MLQKKPITPQILLAFKSHLNLDNPLHATFWAVCLVVSLPCKVFSQFDSSKHLRGEDILFFTDWAIIINRWSKTIQFSQRLLTSVTWCCPASNLLLYSSQACLSLGSSTFIGPSLYHPSIHWGRPDSSDLWTVDSLLKLLAAKTNIDPSQVSGHSLRSGVATLAFQAQIPAELIKRLGDWQSDAYRSYIHIPGKDRIQAAQRLASFV